MFLVESTWNSKKEKKTKVNFTIYANEALLVPLQRNKRAPARRSITFIQIFYTLLPSPSLLSPFIQFPFPVSIGKASRGGRWRMKFFLCLFLSLFFFQTPSHLSLLNGKNIARVITATRPTGRTPWVIGPILGKFLRLDWLYKRTGDFFKLLNVLFKGGFVFFFQAFFFQFLMWIINISIPIREK